MFFIISNLVSRLFKKLYVILKITQFKLLYGSKFVTGKHLSFRKGLKVIIVDEAKLSIGDNCFFNHNCSISCLGNISIGDDCLFGENVKFYDHNHKFSNANVKIKDQGMSVGSIEIGDNCWLGSNVTVLNNVTIGANVVIGANCLISKNIPSNSVVRNVSGIMVEERRNAPIKKENILSFSK